MKTWLKWIGDKHQAFADWCFKEDLTNVQMVLRLILFYIVDSLLWTAAICGVLVVIIAIASKFVKNEPIMEE